jgi:hypothetical protein
MLVFRRLDSDLTIFARQPIPVLEHQVISAQALRSRQPESVAISRVSTPNLLAPHERLGGSKRREGTPLERHCLQ